MNKKQLSDLKAENDRLYKVAMNIDNSLAEKKKISFTVKEFTESIKVQNGNPAMLLNQLVAYGFIKAVTPPGHYKIQYFPQARKDALTEIIKGITKQAESLNDQLEKLKAIKELI